MFTDPALNTINAAYHEARKTHEALERRRSRWGERIDRAELRYQGRILAVLGDLRERRLLAR